LVYRVSVVDHLFALRKPKVVAGSIYRHLDKYERFRDVLKDQ
jgi:hypothetical protein